MTAKTHQPDSFCPPTATQVSRHLDRHPPRNPSPLLAWIPLIVLGTALVLTATLASVWAAFLPPLALVAVFAAVVLRARWTQKLAQAVARTEERMMLRQELPSLRAAWRLVPALGTQPQLHARTVAVIAGCLDRLKVYDAALVAYDYLIEHLPSGDPASALLRTQRAIAQLANGQLTDADDALRRLRGQSDAHPLIAATYRLAQLIQQVQTNHWSDAVGQGSWALVKQLRPLGVEAGYGYALVALSYVQLAQAQPNSGAHRRAQAWWSRATLLLPAGQLVDRYADLAPVRHLLKEHPAVPPAAQSHA